MCVRHLYFRGFISVKRHRYKKKPVAVKSVLVKGDWLFQISSSLFLFMDLARLGWHDSKFKEILSAVPEVVRCLKLAVLLGPCLSK